MLIGQFIGREHPTAIDAKPERLDHAFFVPV